MPLKSVKVGGLLEGPLAIVDIELTYINEDTESPIECSYEFPIDQDTVMSRLVAKIGDKEVEAKIKEKERAKEVYADAMAGGNTAVLAERKSEGAESMRIALGGIPPLQGAQISMQLIFTLPVESSSFSFKLPPDFYPNYKKMGAPDPIGYSFEVDLSIKSSKAITQISAPEGAVCTRDEAGTSASVKCTVPCDDFRVFYRSSEMRYPNLLYAESPEYPGEVAVCASLVPTFEPPQP